MMEDKRKVLTYGQIQALHASGHISSSQASDLNSRRTVVDWSWVSIALGIGFLLGVLARGW